MYKHKLWCLFLLVLLCTLSSCGEIPTPLIGGPGTPATPGMESYPQPTSLQARPPEPDQTSLPMPPVMTVRPAETLVPRPTYTPGGPTKPPAPTVLVAPFPTPDFPPAPAGEPPVEMQTLWYPYLSSPDSQPLLRAVQLDGQGQRWGDAEQNLDLGLKTGWPGPRLGSLYLAPDGHSFIADALYGEDHRLFWVQPAAGEVEAIAAAAAEPATFMAWGPDTQVFLEIHPGDLLAEIRLIDLDSPEYKVIPLPAREGGYQGSRALALSPDGTHLADAIMYGPTASHSGARLEIGLRSFPEGARAVVSQYHFSPTAENPSSFPSIVRRSLAWSPDGAHLALVLFRESRAELWLIDPETGEASSRAQGLTEHWPAVWSTDGRLLAFIKEDAVNGPSPVANLWLYDVAASAERPLTDYRDRQVTAVTWSPDGQHLAFSITLANYGEVRIISLDGGESYPVAGPTAPYAPVLWLPQEGGER